MPEPLGPMMPTRSPRMMVVVRSRTIGRSPRANDTPRASITSRPDALGLLRLQLHACRRARAARRARSRSCSSARTRPSLRVRRAWMPVRIHCSSIASLRSNSASSRCLGGERRRLALEIAVVVVTPVGQLAAVELDDARGDAAQEGTIVRHEEQRRARAPRESRSIHSMAPMSRWLVGSSSSSTSGSRTSARASSVWRLRPPRAAAKGASGSRPRCCEHRLDASLRLPRVGRVERADAGDRGRRARGHRPASPADDWPRDSARAVRRCSPSPSATTS